MAHDIVRTINLKWSGKLFITRIAASALLLAHLLFAGCSGTLGQAKAGAIDGAGVASAPQISDVLRVGNKVRIELTGLPATDVILPHEEQIKDDGTITGLTYITNSVPAAGQTTRQLEQAIHDLYVPKFYRHITVTVTSTDRYYYVGGQVNHQGQQIYVGDMTVIKAIHSAGDFTDFARRTKVQLTRTGAKKPIVINCEKALQNPELDVPVYPGDIIFVPRKLL